MIISKNTTKQMSDLKDFFPRGLIQPEGSFRFSVEALLLPAFAAYCGALTPKKNTTSQKNTIHFADLGTGCGVMPLATLLLAQNDSAKQSINLLGTGYEIMPELCEAAKQNALNLGFNKAFNVLNLDLKKHISDHKEQGLSKPVRNNLKDMETKKIVFTNKYDFILTNPPYRLTNCGKVPKSKLRRIALFEECGSINIFANFAKHSLKKHGSLYCVYPLARKDYLLGLLNSLNLSAKQILFIYGNNNKPTPFFMLEAVKDYQGSFTILEPLTLYNNNTITQEALNFCHFLNCNSQRNTAQNNS